MNSTTINHGYKLAPIALFAYNRLDHVKKTIDALSRNPLANESELHIFSDGAKTENEKQAVQCVRTYLNSIEGFGHIYIYNNEYNLGLAQNIINGVTKLVTQYGRVIILEDDIVTEPFFLKFMNTGLEKYQNEKKVMAISGYIEQLQNEGGIPESFFLDRFYCWGWATWDDRWAQFKKNASMLIKDMKWKDIYHLDFDGTRLGFNEVIANYLGEINTWAIFWETTIMNNNGLTLVPQKSLIKNIGFDGSGEHGEESAYIEANKRFVEREIVAFPTEISINRKAREQIKIKYKTNRPDLFRRVYRRVRFIIRYLYCKFLVCMREE